MKLRQPSLGTKAVIFLPFLMSWTLTHFLMAELGCLASTPLQTEEHTWNRLWTSDWAVNITKTTTKPATFPPGRQQHPSQNKCPWMVGPLLLTPSQGRCLWRGRLLQMGWPSERCPGEPSCTACRAISAPGGGYAASWLCADRDTFLKETRYLQNSLSYRQ